MTIDQTPIIPKLEKLSIGIAWCLAWGDKRQPHFDLAILQQMRQALKDEKPVPEETRSLVDQVRKLDSIPEQWLPDTLEDLQQCYPDLWNQETRIGLVYGGATKIKQYVFEAAQLQDIRGASAILDRINLIDLPAFFGDDTADLRYAKQCQETRDWLDQNFSQNTDSYKPTQALIPELIVYSTGGNILAFCPAAYVNDLANAIERRYTKETLTANSCAVGDTFRLLEFHFGLLQNSINNTPWLNWYRQARVDSNSQKRQLVEAYFGKAITDSEIVEAFSNRKSFNELVGKLTAQFQRRRSGNEVTKNEVTDRTSRRYPPMFETHPYLVRDESNSRSTVVIVQPPDLPKESNFSEPLARKRVMGQVSKREFSPEKLPNWYINIQFTWSPGRVESWVRKFEKFLFKNPHKYYDKIQKEAVEEAKRLEEIANASNGFVAYIYADGNNMGGYIQKIKSPQEYQEFSKDIFEATEDSVYRALAQHITPHQLQNLREADSRENRNDVWVHPFEIITIGGDDVLLIVPADKGLAIAQTIGEEFEAILSQKKAYQLPKNEKTAKSANCHRYIGKPAAPSKCVLSMSIGVLITSYDTPIYYAQKLTEQLLKSAKKMAKQLKGDPLYNYHGGTIDFLTLKSVTMISSKIESFRQQEGLTKKKKGKPTLKLYAAPYTLHETGGLLETVKALKQSEFPRSQLYQIRSLLEQGKNTAILNYRYFRARLKPENQKLLKEQFEEAWCQAITNPGNLAPWMFEYHTIFTKLVFLIAFNFLSTAKAQLQYTILDFLMKSTYETIWREMVELYPFIEEPVNTPELEEAKP